MAKIPVKEVAVVKEELNFSVKVSIEIDYLAQS